MSRQGVAGTTIILEYKFFVNGALFDPYQFNSVVIWNQSTGGDILATLTPLRISLGIYQASYDIPLNFPSETLYDEITWIAESGMPSKVQRYNFQVLASTISASNNGTQAVACLSPVTWVNRIGLWRTEDLGNGMGVGLSWQEAIPSTTETTIHYNIYFATNRVDVLESSPYAITTQTTAVINVTPGDEQFFSVRAVEFNTTQYDITTLTQIGNNLYKYPNQQTLLDDIADAYGTTVQVLSTSGFPATGFIQVGSEVMQYSTLDTTSFTITDAQRGAFQTQISAHITGEIIKLFSGFEDGNSVIQSGTAGWFKTNPRNLDALGQYDVDSDGYRANNEDIVTTNLSASESSLENFPYYDSCGYHQLPMDVFNGQCIGSYLGGNFNGLSGFNLQTQWMAQLETMLQVTGQPAVLLRRKQTGKYCRCGSSDLRREHPNARCPYCYGTNFEGGYDRIYSTRAISDQFSNTAGWILVRVNPYVDDVKLDAANGLVQISEQDAWTLGIPNIKDRDVIVSFNQDFTEEFRYEVLFVTRNKLLYNQTGSVLLKIRRLDKTDIIYTYNIDDFTRFLRV